MGAHGLQDQVRLDRQVAHALADQVLRQHARGELGLAAGGFPDAFGCVVGHVETARVQQAPVEIFEAGNGVGNHVADAAVVADGPVPVDRVLAQCRGRDAGDDRRLRQQVFRLRFQLAMGDVDHAESVFHGHALRPFGLHVDVGAAQARQDQRLTAGDQMAAVELGGDVHGEVALAQRSVGTRRVGGGLGEVAAQGDKHFRAPLLHRADRHHGVVAMLTRRLEGEAFFQGIEQLGGRQLVDAHGAVALHVAVTANR
ncbi:hypothetical protein D3C78_619100 [compost metagenome]